VLLELCQLLRQVLNLCIFIPTFLPEASLRLLLVGGEASLGPFFLFGDSELDFVFFDLVKRLKLCDLVVVLVLCFLQLFFKLLLALCQLLV